MFLAEIFHGLVDRDDPILGLTAAMDAHRALKRVIELFRNLHRLKLVWIDITQPMWLDSGKG
jgi:hypothetical protein